MIYYKREVLNKFRIGDLIGNYHTDMVGWIVGMTISGGGDVVFQVKYANDPDEICLVHPKNIYVL